MHDPLYLTGNDQLVRDRIQELHQAAAEVRAARRARREPSSLVERTRLSVGRTLISIGSSVSGQGA